jgi:adenine deaminase
MKSYSVAGQLVDIHNKKTYGAQIVVEQGLIAQIIPDDNAPQHYIMPGFVDAHVHIESSMVLPSAFARAAVRHGTVATVSDPHEIANVCGVEGVHYMIANSKKTPFKVFFGAPSCVPATNFETAGATLDAADVAQLLKNDDIWYLSEMMNYPGVLHRDPLVMEKIAAAQQARKPVDGHAPGLRGLEAAQYAAAGITTDHECVALTEALHKIASNMHILIREGSAARNYDALHPLLGSHPERVMFCSDDKHPDALTIGHINELVVKSLRLGYDIYDVLRAASMNPVQHYQLTVGLLSVGDAADFIVVDNLTELNVEQTYIGGELVYSHGAILIDKVTEAPINQFLAQPIAPDTLRLQAEGTPNIRVIDVVDGQLVTGSLELPALVQDGQIVSDLERDVLKLVVINRYTAHAKPAVGFIHHFGLKSGAIASSVAHDCHNIIAVGVDDNSICEAINALIAVGGGIAVAQPHAASLVLPLPVGGLMSLQEVDQVAESYTQLDAAAKQLGTQLQAPFMSLSFMALLVIPSLKLSDLGLFDGTTFRFVDVVTTPVSE